MDKDAANAGVISANARRVAVLVIHTDEELMITVQYAAHSSLAWPVKKEIPTMRRNIFLGLIVISQHSHRYDLTRRI
ncbi:MAG TPA: hypothetical protein DCP32_12695 [Anaerolineaceae bacterium]|nr:MAG: hypothetical protein A2X24_07170 [Chloroflexi bacterium GWB2_54_36]HAL17562.1 hypothetical protein [Anaerolineaceae bacterium]